MNASRWNVEVTNSPHNNELQGYTSRSANVWEDGVGHLNIRAAREDYTTSRKSQPRL